MTDTGKEEALVFYQCLYIRWRRKNNTNVNGLMILDLDFAIWPFVFL